MGGLEETVSQVVIDGKTCMEGRIADDQVKFLANALCTIGRYYFSINWVAIKVSLAGDNCRSIIVGGCNRNL